MAQVGDYDVMYGAATNFRQQLWPDVEDLSERADKEDIERWEGRPVSYVLPLNFVNYVDQKLFTPEYSLLMRYTTMFYMALLIHGGNELAPVNVDDMIVFCLSMLIAAFSQALIFGDIANYTEKILKSSTRYQSQLDAINNVMELTHIEDEVQNDVRNFFRTTQFSRE